MSLRPRSGILVVTAVVLAGLVALLVVNGVALATYRAQAVMAAEVLTAGEPEETEEPDERPQRTTTVPRLVDLLEMDVNGALAALARGATLQATEPLPASELPEASEAVILLTAEYAPPAVAQPTVVLGLDEQGRTLRAGYEASMASLGYGSISFSDAILNVGVIEAALAAAGVPTTTPMALPADPMSYSVYGADGRTLATQQISFDGQEAVGERLVSWSATLTYDYRDANESGNLADTRRYVALTITTP